MASHHPRNGPLHISPADRFINSPPPPISIVDLSVFPRRRPKIHNRSGVSGRVHKLVRGRFVNRPLYWADGVGPLLRKDCADGQDLSGHYSRDWSEYVNVIGAISGPFAREFR